jgi:hypothetical protein
MHKSCKDHDLYMLTVGNTIVSGEATGGFRVFKPPTFLKGHSWDSCKSDEKNSGPPPL